MDKRERTAVAAFVKFDRLYHNFVAELQPSHVAEWEELVRAYEADGSLPDPYYWKPAGRLNFTLAILAANLQYTAQE